MELSINGTRLHVTDVGAGTTLLCVHGFPLSGALWAPLVEALAADYRLIVPDLRGFGHNAPADTLSMTTFADDLAAVLDTVGEQQPVVLVGLSMGGYICFEFFRRYPVRTRGLILVDTRAQGDDAAGKQKREETAQRVLAEGSSVVADDMGQKLFAERADEALRQRWHRIMRNSAPTSVAAALRAMGERPDSTATLAGIDVPTLIVVGEDDAITPPDAARYMAERIAHARLEIVEGAGHMTPVEQPQRFAALVGDFMAGLDVRER